MKKNILLFVLSIASSMLFSQEILPKNFLQEELDFMKNNPDIFNIVDETEGSIFNPPSLPSRNMAQWEEVQALTIAWTSYQSVLKDIVKAAQKEVKVIIVCGSSCSGSTDSNSVKSYLTSNGVPLTNLRFIHAPCNSVWIRDYMGNTCYLNDVDSLIMVDWKYNRPTRPKDDTVPRSIAKILNIPLYEMSQGSNQVVATGGNYMTDGLGRSFSSKLILNENSTKTEAQINALMQSFMGVNPYIKMNTLPYDGIHHIDMHMKLLNEETILVGQYPQGIADGPQIEANLQYVLSNFTTSFGTPFKVIRVPMPPDQMNGYTYPNNGGNYLTYTNSTIINKTIIVPQFYTQYDTTAIRIFKQAMPGYTVVGINSNATISASGSLHCITHSVGVPNPLWMVHQNLPNTTNTTTPYQVDATIKHKSGIQWATLYYTTDTTKAYTPVNMNLTGASTGKWTGYIPAQPGGTTVFYYIKAHANSGKEQVRPMVAPKGVFIFKVTGTTTNVNEISAVEFSDPFPNPSKGITCIPFVYNTETDAVLKVYDVLGNEVETVFNGNTTIGEKKFFINTMHYKQGVYFISFEFSGNRIVKKLIVR